MLSQHEQEIRSEKDKITLIKNIAKRYGITYSDLADKSGIPIKTLQKITSFDLRYYGTDMNKIRIVSLAKGLITLLDEKQILLQEDKDILLNLHSSLFIENVDTCSEK